MTGRRARPSAFPSPRGGARCCVIETTPRSSLFVSEATVGGPRAGPRTSGVRGRTRAAAPLGVSACGLASPGGVSRARAVARRVVRRGDAVRLNRRLTREKSGKARRVTCQVRRKWDNSFGATESPFVSKAVFANPARNRSLQTCKKREKRSIETRIGDIFTGNISEFEILTDCDRRSNRRSTRSVTMQTEANEKTRSFSGKANPERDRWRESSSAVFRVSSVMRLSHLRIAFTLYRFTSYS